jgi:hypothetical protein
MTFFEKVREMLGLGNKPKSASAYIGPDVSKAVQRNEQSNAEARRELEKLKITHTIRNIAGKM